MIKPPGKINGKNNKTKPPVKKRYTLKAGEKELFSNDKKQIIANKWGILILEYD